MMRSKIFKVIATVSIIMLTLAITVVPAFANIIGDSRNSNRRASFYLESLSFNGNPELTFNNNSFYPAEYSYYTSQLTETAVHYGLQPLTNNGLPPDILGNNIYGASGIIGFFGYNDQFPSSLTRLRFETNTFTFEFAHDHNLGNFPKLSLDLSNIVFDGFVSCVCIGQYLRDGVVTDFSQEMELPLLDENSFNTTTASVFLTELLDGGDIVSMRMVMTADVVSAYNDEELGISFSYSSNGARMLDSMIITHVTDQVDVFQWLPTVVDNFLNTPFLPGVTFGNLLAMVIAIPALFAVLKMLGGGG